ncbi:MAG: FG-GAP-like repeat-containing protein [Actinomycetota bacterium]|nr:FG-GAP-like repeat-containing protein [Actinomycetota bacterium]
MTTNGYLGTIDGSFSVDSDGGATYTIPLNVPPGTARMAPSLTLAYNSGAGNGMLGTGWSIQGLSAITRTAATQAQDGQRGTITYGPGDRFTLDGQRLMVVNGVDYAATNAVFHTEIETWTRVTPAYEGNVAGRSGPDYFLVETKDGKTMEYGRTPDSQATASPTNPSVRVWALNKVTDANGNSLAITYEPDPDNGVNYPLQIDYTANEAAGLAPGRSVQFSYEPRPDVLTRYVGGFPVATRQRLRQVQTAVGGETVRTYTVAYEQAPATGRSRLVSVTEADGSGVGLPPTVFAWQDGDAAMFVPDEVLAVSGVQWQGRWLPMDVNGDGRTDLVNAYSSGGKLQLTLLLSDGTGFSAPIVLPATQVPWSDGIQLLPMDVDGDGCIDLVCATENNGHVGLTVLHAQQGDDSWQLVPGALNGAGGAGLSWGGTLIGMDVDGDGMTDLVYAYQSGEALALSVLYSNGSAFQPVGTQPRPTVDFFPRAQYFAMDFNGDGMTDLVYAYQEGDELSFTLFLSAGRSGGLVQQAEAPLPDPSGVPALGTIVALDVNGDGLADLVHAYVDDGALVVQTILSNGVSFEPPSPQTFKVPTLGNAPPGLLPMEVNGDGLPDLVIATQQGEGVALDVLLSNGSGFDQLSGVTQPSDTVRWGTTLLPLDYNGDGKTDVVYAAQAGNDVSLAAMPAAGSFPDLLTTVTNGLGGTIEIGYAPLTDPTVYTKNAPTGPSKVEVASLLNNAVTGSAYTVGALPSGPAVTGSTPTTRLVTFPKYVVSTYTKNDGRTAPWSFAYRYSAALMDLTGRGWLGFATVEVDDASFATTTTTEYDQEFPTTHCVTGNTLARTSDGAAMHRTTYQYDPLSSPPNTGPGVSLVLTQSTTVEYFTFADPADPQADGIEVKAFTYDAFGNTATIGATGSALGAPVYTSSTYANDPTAWHLGLLTERTITADAAGKEVLKREQRTYDPVTVNLLTTSVWNDQVQAMETTTWGYDAFGNRTSCTDCSQATTDIAYDPAYHAFVASTTTPPNAAGRRLVTTYSHSPQFGSLESTTDPNNVTTAHLYDGLGREIETRGPDPDGQTVTLSQVTWGTTGGTYVETDTLTDWSGTMRWDRQFLDGFGRAYRTESLGPDGTSTVVVNRAFNSRNQLVQQSLPHYEGVTAEHAKYTFDAYGRLVELVQPQGAGSVTTTNDYVATDTVKKTDADGTSEARTTTLVYQRFNGLRVVVSSTDALENTTTFGYDPLGRLTSVTDALGVTTATAYDSLDRKISLAVKKGTTTYLQDGYSYDDPTRTVVHTDSKKTTTTQVYDPQGRLVQRTVTPVAGSAAVTTWTFDDPSVANAQGRVTGVSTEGGVSYDYGYDACGNQTSITAAIDGESWVFAKTYTPAKKAATITFPDTSVQTNVFNAAAQLVALSYQAPPSAALVVASYGSIDALGAPRSVTYGNHAVLTYHYDASGRLASQALADGAGATAASWQLGWTACNSLQSVHDDVASATTTFGYDAVGRLVAADGPFGNLQYGYDDGGNLTLKDGVKYTGDWYQASTGTAGGTQVFSAEYDTNGNLVSATRSGAIASYGYDAENRLVTAGDVTFAYDHTGRRVMRRSASGPTVYYPAPYYQVVAGSNGNQQHTVFLFGTNGLAASATAVDSGSAVSGPGIPAPGVFYACQDQLNSTRIQLDADGKVVTSLAYRPFGEVWAAEGPDTVAQKFTGKDYDADLGLYYFGARWYDPVLGRFLTADSRLGAALTARDSLNRYAYGIGDPINNFDPSGHDIFGDVGHFFTHDLGHFVDHDVADFVTHDVKHFFTADVPAFFENEVAATVISYTVDGLLIVAGAAVMATTPFGGPASGVIGSTLLGAGIGGLTYNITTSATHGKFEWGEWGIQLGIGGATGLIAGGVAVGAGAAADALAEGGRLAFAVGGAARIATNVTAGVIGNGGASVLGQLLNNVDPYQQHHGLDYRLGFSALVGGISGGLAAGAAEGVAAKLARVPDYTVSYDDLAEIYRNTPGAPALEPRETYYMRVLDTTIKHNFLLALPGAGWTGLQASGVAVLAGFGWEPSW